MRLTIDDVGKQYRRDFWGLRHLSLDLGPGILGLLGPNGAGKSTLMRMLATITLPSEGRVIWNGIDIVREPNGLRQVLGYLPQDFGIYPNLSAIEFLEYLAAMRGLESRAARRRIDELVQFVNLGDAARRPLGSYSGGMRQRVGIVQALLNDPKLLILDEPTVGLDPEERVHFRQLIADLSTDRLIILSTHIVSDVEATATQIALVCQGQMLRFATPEELLQAVVGKVWEWCVPSVELAGLKQHHLLSNTIRHAEGVAVRVVSDVAPAPQAQHVAPRLEDAYLYFITLKEGSRVK